LYYTSGSSPSVYGFVLSDGTYTTINVPGSSRTIAYGINDLGQIVGLYSDASGQYHGFLATPIPEPSTLLLLAIGTLGAMGWAWRKKRRAKWRKRPQSIAGLCGLVVLGLLVVGAGGAKGQPSYVYTTLDVPGSLDTFANGINDAGQVVGWWADHNGRDHGFLYSGGRYSTLDAPGSSLRRSGVIFSSVVHRSRSLTPARLFLGCDVANLFFFGSRWWNTSAAIHDA
jgi:probable HAF family extracellular repeat protein